MDVQYLISLTERPWNGHFMLLTRGQFSDKRRLGIDTLANICDHSVVGFAAHRSSKCEAIAALRGVRSGSPINRGRQLNQARDFISVLAAS